MYNRVLFTRDGEIKDKEKNRSRKESQPHKFVKVNVYILLYFWIKHKNF